MSTRMDAVLPVLARDLPRARILLRSLERNFSGLGTLYVITPAQQLAEVREALASFSGTLQTCALSELDLVPELATSRALRGWHRQQLLKLGIAERIETENYLTLDADVICVRPTTPSALAPDGKGLCHVIPEDLHPDWYRGSLQVLGLPPRRQHVLHNVTPAVLSRQAVLSLQQHLAARARAGQFRRDWVGLRQRAGFALARWSREPRELWRWYLMTGAPWTEYALYYSYLESTDQFERHHTLTSQCIYAIEQSVWRSGRKSFGSWDPSPLFRGEGAPYFAIVQSITRIAPERVWEKVAPFLEGAPASETRSDRVY